MLHLLLSAQLVFGAGPQYMRIYAYNSSTRGIQEVNGDFKITNNPSLFTFRQRNDKLIEFQNVNGKPLLIRSDRLQAGGKNTGWIFRAGSNKDRGSAGRFNHFQLANGSRCITQNGNKVEAKPCDRSKTSQLFNIQVGRGGGGEGRDDSGDDAAKVISTELYEHPQLYVSPEREKEVIVKEDEILTLRLRRPARETKYVKVVEKEQPKPESKEERPEERPEKEQPVPVIKPQLVAIPPGAIPVQTSAVPLVYSQQIVPSESIVQPQQLYVRIPQRPPEKHRHVTQKRRPAGSYDETESGVSDINQEFLDSQHSQESENPRRKREEVRPKLRRDDPRKKYAENRRNQPYDHESETNGGRDSEGESEYQGAPPRQKHLREHSLGRPEDFDRDESSSSKRDRPSGSGRRVDPRAPRPRGKDYDDGGSRSGRDEDESDEGLTEKLRKSLHLRPRESSRRQRRDTAGTEGFFEKILNNMASSREGRWPRQGRDRHDQPHSSRDDTRAEDNSRQYAGDRSGMQHDDDRAAQYNRGQGSGQQQYGSNRQSPGYNTGNALSGNNRNQYMGGPGQRPVNAGGLNQQNMGNGGQTGMGGASQRQAGNRVTGGAQPPGSQMMGSNVQLVGDMQLPGNGNMGGVSPGLGNSQMGGVNSSSSMGQSGDSSNYQSSSGSRDGERLRSPDGAGMNASIKYDKSEIPLRSDGAGGSSDGVQALNQVLKANNLDDLIDLFERSPSGALHSGDQGGSSRGQSRRGRGSREDHGEPHHGIKRTHGHIDANERGIKIERIETKGLLPNNRHTNN